MSQSYIQFCIRRPLPQLRSTPVRNDLRRWPWIPRFFFARRDSEPWWRPKGWYTSPFMWWRGQQYFFPSLITVWRVGPRSWSIQWDFAQAWRRRLFTRCAYCGGKGRSVNAYLGNWAPETKTHFWQSEQNLFHGGRCARAASIIIKKNYFETNPPKKWARNLEVDQEPYWGSYSWWREAVLDEPRTLAIIRAGQHVQRSMLRCERCRGEGTLPYAATDVGVKESVIALLTIDCPDCDGTGHPIVEDPILEGDVL